MADTSRRRIGAALARVGCVLMLLALSALAVAVSIILLYPR